MNRIAKILVVDDNPKNVKLLADILEVKNYAVITALSGLDALDQLANENPDLILLDVMMPDMSGYEVCQQIRINPDTRLLPVVMVTALDATQERVKGIEAGADDFLTKPVNRAELFARVRSLLRIKELYGTIQTQANQLAQWNKELQVKLEQETKLAEVARSIGDLGHDIKNMLMPILSGAGLLEDELNDHFTNLPEKQGEKSQSSQEISREIIAMMRNNASRIQNQVRDMADCVNGLSSPPQFSTCQLVEIANQVIGTLHFLAEEKGISLQTEGLEDLPTIQADGPRLFKALYNLINNGIPEVPRGGSITVKGNKGPSDNWVVLSIEDTGRGMTQEVRENLFTKRTVSTKPGGTGLGTKIIKDVVDAHGGEITVDSEVGKGTSFHVRLPISPSDTVVQKSQP